jgi:hypothetical protein
MICLLSKLDGLGCGGDGGDFSAAGGSGRVVAFSITAGRAASATEVTLSRSTAGRRENCDAA